MPKHALRHLVRRLSSGLRSPRAARRAAEPNAHRLAFIENDLSPIDGPPHMFAVVTWGCSASLWLAHALNSHPEIFCLHAANWYWNRLGGAPYLDGVRYMRLIKAQGRGCHAAGDIHGISRHHIPKLRNLFGDNFRSSVTVREPISRLFSQLAHFQKYAHLRSWNVSYVTQLRHTKQLELPDDQYETLLFVHGANMLNAIIEEATVGKIFRCEDLTTNSECICEFIEYNTANKVVAEVQWADQIIMKNTVNQHRSQNETPKNYFSDWQKDVITRVVTEEAWRIYEDLGYDVQIP